MTAFPWLVDGGDAREFCRALAGRGVLMVPGDCFEMPSHFRIGFGASGDRFPLAIERFSEFLRAPARRRSPDMRRGAAAPDAIS
jgi:aspartate/methionine/tyrosine aminotransferase